jgi:hypothetical protein
MLQDPGKIMEVICTVWDVEESEVRGGTRANPQIMARHSWRNVSSEVMDDAFRARSKHSDMCREGYARHRLTLKHSLDIGNDLLMMIDYNRRHNAAKLLLMCDLRELHESPTYLMEPFSTFQALLDLYILNSIGEDFRQAKEYSKRWKWELFHTLQFLDLLYKGGIVNIVSANGSIHMNGNMSISVAIPKSLFSFSLHGDILPWNSQEFKYWWDYWLMYRKTELRQKPYSSQRLMRIFGELDRLSGGNEHTAIRIIYQSIVKGYLTFYPLKDGQKGQQGSDLTDLKKSIADRLREI